MSIIELIRDLELLRSKNLSCEDFRIKYLEANRPDDVRPLPDIAGNLSHFLDDEDWRKKNAGYEKMQNAELDKLIRLLKEGAPEAELKRINFLGYSK